MAVDVCSGFSSPRISFSHDLKEPDHECYIPRSDAFLLESTIDFDFCIDAHIFSQQLSSADELFANGKILPVEVKKTQPCKEIHQAKPVSKSPQQITRIDLKTQKSRNAGNEETKKKMLKEFLSSNFDAEEKKPFWQFRRSSSVNCENRRNNSNGLIRSLQFLSRSNSTGSAPNQKPSSMPSKVVMQKQRSSKERSIARSSSSVSSSTQFYSYNSTKGRSLKKSYSHGVRVNPVLNIPHTYISKGTVSLFGLCSFFSNSKSKKKKK